ncbi:MAG: excinuclease ABC subunit A, partial [Planctomycetota bacterium]
PRDNGRLVRALFKLRDLGNTVVLVEHDREVLEAADRLYDFGPGAGRLGGTVVAEGSPKELAKSAESLTGKYLADVQGVPVPRLRRVPADVAVPDDAELRSDDGRPTHEAGWLELLGCRHHNLREVDLRIPLATLTCVTGVSGSGKSSLIEGTLAPAVARRLSRSAGGPKTGPHRDLFGVQNLSKVIAVDQQPLGATPASNPATYTGVFDHIRDLFARLPEAKVRGYKSGRFSFNRPGGRCEACEGLGEKKIEMHFLPDVWVTCEECQGRRYNAETLAVKFRGKTISDVLEMAIGEAYELFEQVPKIRAGLGVLTAIGLDYLTLGQGAQTLSGGEAQRVKLAAELARPEAGRTLYLLDEPTTGLHLDDIRKLLQVLNGLVDKGNTVVVVEHNLDVIKTADWVVDVGPEAGVGGGSVVVSGPPEVIAECDSSHTGRMLAPLLKEGKKADRETFDVDLERKKRSGDLSMREVGKDAKMPWQVDGKAWHSGGRPAHNGKPVKYDAGLVPFVVDLIEKVGGFAPAKWNDKAIVEVLHESKQGGWFFHAKTGLEWFVHLTFRVKKRTFDPADLAARFPWPPADDLDIPTYGGEPRVWCKHPPVPWQEVTFKPHSVDELDTDEFRAFLEEAKAAYLAQAFPDGPAEAGEGNGKAFSADEPWKTLGRTWHLSKRGLPDGRIAWSHKTLTTLAEMLEEVFADSAVDWTKKATATWKRGGKPVAELTTKRRTGIDLVLPIEPGAVTLGQVIDFGVKPSVGRHRGGEAVKLRFTAGTQVTPALKAFLSGLG